MTALTFSSVNGSYVATIQSQSSTINVDIERSKSGAIIVQQKAHEATRYKGGQIVPTSEKCADVNFNIIHEADGASLDYKIISPVLPSKAYYG